MRQVNRFRVVKAAATYNGCKWIVKDNARLYCYLHNDLESRYQSTIFSAKVQAWYKTRKEARDTIARLTEKNGRERVDISRVW